MRLRFVVLVIGCRSNWKLLLSCCGSSCVCVMSWMSCVIMVLVWLIVC